MKNIFAFLLLSLVCSQAYTQGNMFAQWDKKALEKANTAKDADYLTAEEKRVIFFCNLARINPPLFSQTILEVFLDSTGYKNSAYVVSLKKTLSNTKPGQPFTVQKDLADIARGHAEKMGKAGKKGHEGFDKRYKGAMKTYNQYVGENCSYGFDNALRIVMQLLIDEGVGDSGHRKNILDPKFKNAGVAIREHRTANWNCVISFGG